VTCSAKPICETASGRIGRGGGPAAAGGDTEVPIGGKRIEVAVKQHLQGDFAHHPGATSHASAGAA